MPQERDSLLQNNARFGDRSETDPGGQEPSSSQPPGLRSWARHSTEQLSSVISQRYHRKFTPSSIALGMFGVFMAWTIIAFAVGVLVPGKPAGTSASGALDAKFIVVGDWGREGNYNQTVVASGMAAVARSIKPICIISTGDNFYPNGLSSVYDHTFLKSFKEPYGIPGLLGLDWYSVLGNHDYGDGSNANSTCTVANGSCTGSCCVSSLHQLDSRLRMVDPRWHAYRSFNKVWGPPGAEVEFFFIDTNPFVGYYYQKAFADYPGGLTNQSSDANLLELEGQLQASSAMWKVVVGHHPVYTNGAHNNTQELVDQLAPVLERNGVRLYINGHDHCQQLIHHSGVYYATSGAGSQTRIGFNGANPALYQSDVSGFLALSFSPASVRLDYYTIVKGEGQPDYSYIIKRQT